MAAPSPFANASAATQRALISELLGADEELRALAATLLKAAMLESIHQLARGDAATRAAIARAYVAPITKALTESDTDDGDQTLRAEMQTMFAEMRGDMGLEDYEDQVTASEVVSGQVAARVIVPKS